MNKINRNNKIVKISRINKAKISETAEQLLQKYRTQYNIRITYILIHTTITVKIG